VERVGVLKPRFDRGGVPHQSDLTRL
jgi:hypothetical protein